MSRFLQGVRSRGHCWGRAGSACWEAAGVRPSRLAHLCSPAGLGEVQERLKNHKPDSSPRVTSLGPLLGHLCSIFSAVSKTRNLSFKLKLRSMVPPDSRSWGFERGGSKYATEIYPPPTFVLASWRPQAPGREDPSS